MARGDIGGGDAVLVFVGQAALGFDHADVARGFVACHYGHGYV